MKVLPGGLLASAESSFVLRSFSSGEKLFMEKVNSITRFLQGKTHKNAKGREVMKEMTRIENEFKTSSIVVK